MRGRAYLRAGDLESARSDLERAYAIARSAGDATQAGDATLIVGLAATLATTLLELGAPKQAREYLEAALRVSTVLDEKNTVKLEDVLAMSLMKQRDLPGARE